jgi:hypothetical protein
MVYNNNNLQKNIEINKIKIYFINDPLYENQMTYWDLYQINLDIYHKTNDYTEYLSLMDKYLFKYRNKLISDFLNLNV